MNPVVENSIEANFKKILSNVFPDVEEKPNKQKGRDYLVNGEVVVSTYPIKEGHSIHLMPLYCFPEIDSKFHDKVKKWRTGKSCLNFKTKKDEIDWGLIEKIMSVSKPLYDKKFKS